MIDILLKLAARLDDLGQVEAAQKIDKIVARAVRSPELDKMIEEMNRGAKPLESLTHEEMEAGTEKLRQQRLEHDKTHPISPGEWTRHPGITSWREIGRIHAEQDARRPRKDPIPGWPNVGQTSLMPARPDALHSLLQYKQNGPEKGSPITLDNALEYAKGYLSEEKELSDDEKEAQIQAVRNHADLLGAPDDDT